MLATIESSVAKMNRILMQLRSGGPPVEQPTPIPLDDVVAQAVLSKSAYKPKPRLEIVDKDLWVAANAERLERVIGHLIQNAIEATPADGQVVVRMGKQDANAVIEVADTGMGMSAEFVRDALFKPFESTKRTGMGIGTYESREYIRELGGKMEVHSEVDKGSRFEIVLPVVEGAGVREGIRLLHGVG
jgi:putative PEP-CTERM system histidine kinase